jgi:hypothetical protein
MKLKPGHGGGPRQVESDKEGIEIMQHIGKTMAWLMNKIYY